MVYGVCFVSKTRSCAALCSTGSAEVHGPVLRDTRLWDVETSATSPVTAHVVRVLERSFHDCGGESYVANQEHVALPGRLFVPLDHIEIRVRVVTIYPDFFSGVFDQSTGTLSNTVL